MEERKKCRLATESNCPFNIGPGPFDSGFKGDLVYSPPPNCTNDVYKSCYIKQGKYYTCEFGLVVSIT